MGPQCEIARYDRRVVRMSALTRYFYVLALGVIVTACGAAAPSNRPIARGEPLPVGENQQGHHEDFVVADNDDGTAEELGAPLVDQPSIAGVYLWCQSPTGRACAMATAALGTGPKDPSGLPPGLLVVEDRDNDCNEPTIATVSGRIGTALSMVTTNWRDQGGSYLDLASLGDMYAAAGCINDGDPLHPVAKISAADGASPRVYLVRVWETQPAAGVIY